MKEQVKKILPHIAIIVIFILISLIYFYPTMGGKVLNQMDHNHSKGVAQEIEEFENETGEFSLWTNSIFGGMPSYQIKGGEQYNIYAPIRRTLRLGLPYTTASVLFIYMLGFYLLLISIDVNKWLSFVGSIAFGLSSYNIIIIMAGHITKCYAIAYMAPVIAGFLFIFNKKKYLLGGIFAAVALGLQLSTSHVQIVYYTGMLVGLLVLYKFIMAFVENEIPIFGKSMAVIVIAVMLAILPNMMMLNRYQEVAKYSIRGEKYINKSDDNDSGLDKNYALAWSYGIGETLTFLIPNAKGGVSGYIGQNKDVMDKIDSDYKDAIGEQNQYWGSQPFTSGPVYLGAIIMFLFVLAMFVIKDKIKWWLFAGTILSIMLSWGQNFDLLTDFFFNYVPFYNKFRTVSMTLVIASVTVPLLAIMGVNEIIKDKTLITKNLYVLFTAFGLTGGIALIFGLIPSFFSFLNPQEADYFDSLIKQSPDIASQIKVFVPELESARQLIFKADAMRSFLYILLATNSIFFFVKMKEFKKEYLFIALGVFIIADMWTIDQRYLNADMFQSKSVVSNEFKAAPVDEFILKDKDPNYRVLNLTRSVFNDAYTPYFHKSIGGYHGAKLRKYQDIIDVYLAPYVQSMQAAIQEDKSDVLSEYIPQMQVLNMLNTKYIIENPNVTPFINNYAFGNAWFVDAYKMVDSYDDEINNLDEVNLLRTVVINKKNVGDYKLPELNISANDSGSIILTSYKPNHLTYRSNSTKTEFAVFSEIYYPKGWQVYLDNKEVEHINVNYILRGMQIPAGSHIIEFKFEPKSYYLSRTIAIIGSLLVLLAIFGSIAKIILNKRKKITT